MGVYHDFWLFREGERTYQEDANLWGRKDAPLRIPTDLIEYLYASLRWVPTFVHDDLKPYPGLNHYGTTVLNHVSGASLRIICAA